MRRDETEARRLVRDRSGGACELCDERRAVEFQHRKNRSQGGRWSASNGLDLCSECHRYIHANPAESDAEGWTVKQWEGDPGEKVVTLGRGYCKLDDAGGVTNYGHERPRFEHVESCGFWESEFCSCGGVA